MGQTQSQGKQADVSQIYASYIQKQQDLIYQQQSQINSLYRHNLQSQPQMPPNMYFQNGIQQQQQQQQQQQRYLQQPQIPQLPPAPNQHQTQQQTQQLNPYQILGLPKQYDETMLKKAYLKKAMKTHPDRGGTPQLFQQVSIAYTLLTKKLKEHDSKKSHNDLRNEAKGFIQTPESQPKRNINMKDNFDVDTFNKIYDDNKIRDVYDSGYGSWMEKNPALESGQTKMFQNGFNKDMFNATFEQYKQENAKQHQGQLVKYDEPEVRLSMANQDSLVTLGQKKVSDFSGSTSNLEFTDYKKAYTYGSTMIDANSVSLDGRANSIDGVKSQRGNLSYQLSPEDQRKRAIQQMKEQQEEEKRVQRLQVYDQKHGQAYERIHGLLLR